MLVVISQKTNFDLKHVISCPITEFPLSIVHSDGSRMTTPKCKFLDKLVSKQNEFDHTPILPIDVTLLDGGLLLHSFLSSIGEISSYQKIR